MSNRLFAYLGGFPKILIFLLPPVLLLSGCSEPANPGDYSVVLITLDTTRADRIGTYGGKQVPTPNLDRIGREGVVFEDAVSQVPLTLPAHSSIFTGRYPVSHGVRHNGMYRLPDDEVTLAEIFTEAGFATAGFVGAFVLNSRFGTGQGFATYDEFEDDGYQKLVTERSAEDVNRQVFAWLNDLNPEDRFFLWVHYYDPHSPYKPPESSEKKLEGAGYDREISYVDACIGDLIERLEEKNVLDLTFLVVVGDHGEMLGEHGEEAHGVFLYEGATHVPFMIRAPGLLPKRRRVQGPVELVDVAPTILDYLEIDSEAPMQGEALRISIDDKKAQADYAFAESLMPRLDFGWSEIHMVREGRFKYIRSPRPELYDLKSDPGETQNLADFQKDRLAEMETVLAEHLQIAGVEGSDEEAGYVLSPEEESKLRSLGYLGGSSGLDTVSQANILPDPKDMIHEQERIGRAKALVDAGRHAEAVDLFGEILKVNPGNQTCHTMRMISLLKLRRVAEAEEEALALLALASEQPDAFSGLMFKARSVLAAIYWISGKKEEALDQYKIAQANVDQTSHRPTYKSLLLGAAGNREDAEWIIGMMQEKNPDDPMAVCARFEIEQAAGDEPAALEAAERLAELQDGDGFNLYKAASLLNDHGNYGAAATLFGVVADRTEPTPDLLGYLGTSRLRSGNLEGARETFLRVIEMRPDDPRAPFYLGNIALLKEDESAARDYYKRSLAVNGQFVPPLVNLARYLAAKGRVDEAEQVLADALERRPGDPGASELLQKIRNRENVE